MTYTDVTNLCKRVVHSSDDPFWARAAREVLEAVLCEKLRERKTNWTWEEVLDEIRIPENLFRAAVAHNPSLRPLCDPGSRASAAVISTLESALLGS